MQQCFSGGFIPELENLKTFIATASKYFETANECDDINPDGADEVENEIYNDSKYYHGEFNYHMLNATNLKTIIGNELSNIDIDGNGKASLLETFNWEIEKNSRLETPQYSDLGNIGADTYLNVAPSAPQNVNALWYNNHPKVSWSKNPEYDILSYKVYKMIVGQTGWLCVATVSSQVTEWTDNSITPAGKFDPVYTIKYKVQAIDLVNNASEYSAEKTIFGTTDNIWKQNISGTEAEGIETYKLFSNYPNPFNPATQITYQIPKSSFVTLKVYDTLGKEVATLVNERKEQGRYTVEFNAESALGGLPSGMYIYQITAGKFRASGKMLLMK